MKNQHVNLLSWGTMGGGPRQAALGRNQVLALSLIFVYIPLLKELILFVT